jgi:hypothetical protein
VSSQRTGIILEFLFPFLFFHVEKSSRLLVPSQRTGILLEFLFHFLFFHIEKSRRIPVPVKKTEGTGIPQVLLPLRTYTKKIRNSASNPLQTFKKMNDDDNVDNNDEIDDYIHQFINRRTIPRRTNWRYRFMSLNQREVSQANTLQLSISDHVEFFLLMILLTNQLLTMLHLSR